jgi:hypothetical protein
VTNVTTIAQQESFCPIFAPRWNPILNSSCCIFLGMSAPPSKYAAFLARLQEELMTAATQHSVAWRFGNWTARQRLLLVHERLLRDVRRNLQRLNNHVLKEAPEFRKSFGAEFQRWTLQLPEPAKEQLELLKEYTEVFADRKTN